MGGPTYGGCQQDDEISPATRVYGESRRPRNRRTSQRNKRNCATRKENLYPFKKKIEKRKLGKSKRAAEGVDGWRGAKGEGDPEPKYILYGGFTLGKRNYCCGLSGRPVVPPIGIPPIPKTPHMGGHRAAIVTITGAKKKIFLGTFNIKNN